MEDRRVAEWSNIKQLANIYKNWPSTATLGDSIATYSQMGPRVKAQCRNTEVALRLQHAYSLRSIVAQNAIHENLGLKKMCSLWRLAAQLRYALRGIFVISASFFYWCIWASFWWIFASIQL